MEWVCLRFHESKCAPAPKVHAGPAPRLPSVPAACPKPGREMEGSALDQIALSRPTAAALRCTSVRPIARPQAKLPPYLRVMRGVGLGKRAKRIEG